MVWCGIWKDHIIGPFFFNEHDNGDTYLHMPEEQALASVLNEDGELPTWFQHIGAPAHYSIRVREFLDQQFPGHWIERRGPVEWPARSPDLTPIDFYLWGHLKAQVYTQKIRNVKHLRQSVIEACNAITPGIIKRVFLDRVKRLNLCTENNGGHIEKVL
jgi:hypothetical protein